MAIISTGQNFCSDLSLQAGEPLIGTATPTRVYLLLEYNGVWGEKALEESELPEAVKAHLKAYSKSSPDTKALLIKRRGAARESGIRFFVGTAAEGNPSLYSFRLDRYDDLLALELDKISTGTAEFQSYRQESPVFLVCTNGRRDPCCARRGVQVLNALSHAASEYVWESSHVGGHRFAANLTILPHGLLYGRVDGENAVSILNAYLRGEENLPNLRGRTCYAPVVQAADYYLRQETGILSLDAFHLDDAQELSPHHWQVRFVSPTGERYLLVIVEGKTDLQVYESCLLDKSTTITRYDLETCSVLKEP
jgi:hypothetical protein